MLLRRLNPNGDFAVWQMGHANPSAAHGVITADAYYLQNTTGAVLRVEKSADAPSFAEAGFVVRQSMKVTVLTATNPSDTENAGIVHTGTGDRFAQMLLGRAPVRSLLMKASGPFTLSYGLRSNIPYFTYAAGADVDQTWRKFTASMPVPPATDWGAGSARGYASFLFLGGGSAFAQQPNVWEAGPKGVVPTQSNFLGAVGNTLWIAADQLEADVASPFEQRPYEDEEWDCLRYIQKSFWRDVAPKAGWANQNSPFHAGQHYFAATRAGGNGWQGTQIDFKRPMITPPVVSIYNPIGPGSLVLNWSRATTVGASIDAVTEKGFRLSAADPIASLGDTLVTGWLANASVGPG
jgi:hypothetical protein